MKPRLQDRERRTQRSRSSASSYLRSPHESHSLFVGVAVCVALAIVVWISFGGAVHNSFVNFDDGDYVYENPQVTSGITLQGIQWAFTHVHAANWHPLTTISHMLDCQFYGLQPWGHHLTNVLLHAAAAVLLFLAMLKLTGPKHATTLPSSAVIDRRYEIWPCAFVAALFAVHPLRVESVAWVSERKDVLSGVFFMLTLLAYARYVRSERFLIGRYLTVIVLFTLGLMCKPTLVTLPFVLLLLDYWPLGRWPSAKGEEQIRLVRSTSQHRQSGSDLNDSTSIRWSVVSSLLIEKIPLFLLSAASCLVTIFAQQKALDTDLNLTVSERVGNAIISYVTYLGQLVYPAKLAVFYPYRHLEPFGIALGLILLVAISVAFFIWRRKYPFLLIGWLWYLGFLIPTIGLVQVGLQPRADRYTYLPQIGLYIVIVWSFTAVAMHWVGPWKRAVVTVIGLFTICTLTLSSRAQTLYWRTSQSLWEHAIQNTSGNYIAYNNLGTVLLRQKLPDAALVQFRKALEIKPDFENAYVSAGSALMLMGQIDQAIEYYKKALELRPNSAEDWSNLATAQLKRGEPEEVIADYKKAVALKPDSAELQYNLGRALADNREWNDAIGYYRAAIRIQPNEARFHNNLGVALIKVGKADEALQELREALRVNPNYPEAHYNFGSVLLYLGRKDEAAAQFEDALRLKPDYSLAKEQLQQLGVPVSP